MYEELKSHNFEIVAVAEDSGGHTACDKFYERAKATFTALVDEQHQVSALYHMVNVPSGVWVDETGHMVRPPEVAYTVKQILGQKVEGDRYVAALRDWVLRGTDSPFAMSPEQLRARLPGRSPQEQLAEANFRLGVWFHLAANEERANYYWQQAQTLHPDSWNYHRQDWSFTPREAMRNWMKKVSQLNGRAYYAPLELPEASAGK